MPCDEPRQGCNIARSRDNVANINIRTDIYNILLKDSVFPHMRNPPRIPGFGSNEGRRDSCAEIYSGWCDSVDTGQDMRINFIKHSFNGTKKALLHCNQDLARSGRHSQRPLPYNYTVKCKLQRMYFVIRATDTRLVNRHRQSPDMSLVT